MQSLDATPLEARFQLTADDSKAFQTLGKAAGGNAAQRLLRSMLALFVLLLVASLVFSSELNRRPTRAASAPTGSSWMSVLGLLIPVVIFAVFWFFITQASKKEAAKSVGFVEPTTMRLDAGGTTHVCGAYTNITQWRGIERIASNETHIAFFHDANQGYLVPRRAFESDQSWQRFVDFARERWEASRPIASPAPPIAAA